MIFVVNKKTRKTFDFEQYPDVLKILEDKPNMTKYIVDLIRDDTNNEIKMTKDSVIEIIEEYLNSHALGSSKDITNQSEQSEDNEKLKASALKILGSDET